MRNTSSVNKEMIHTIPLFLLILRQNPQRTNELQSLCSTRLPHRSRTAGIKSISNRALVINALCEDSIPITNVSDCDDTRVMKQAFTEKNSSIDIHGAGTAMRFLTAYYAQKRDYECIISGSERMKQRPIKILVDALRSLGADIRYFDKEGFPLCKFLGKN